MRKFRDCITMYIIALISIVVLSACISNKDYYIVESENMTLTNYEVCKLDSCEYIQLIQPTGSAYTVLDIPSGTYDIEVRYLADSVGQNVYTMYVADRQIAAWLGKSLDQKWHLLSEQKWHAPTSVEVNKGDTLMIDVLSNNGSSAGMDYISFTKKEDKKRALSQQSREKKAVESQKMLTIPDNLVTVNPVEYTRAIKNPLKGFRPSAALDHEYGTLAKTYFKWNILEDNQTDGVDKIIQESNKRWAGFREHNVKAIPRVYLDWPKQSSGWPSDMAEGDYTSDTFKTRVLAMINKIGKAWDNDHRVAYVEMGFIGHWGEMEFPDTRDDIKEAMAKAFAEAFKNKLVMIRWPNTYCDDTYNFGYYWDSFAHFDQAYYQNRIDPYAKRWVTAPIGGECAYDWGNVEIQPGQSPDISLTTPKHRDYVISAIRRLHANHIGWISKYSQDDQNVRAGAEIMQKALGYRFVISEVKYSPEVSNGLYVSFSVTNTGSSPFYYNWPVEVSLLNPTTKEVVWRDIFKETDIRDWLPGDNWSELKKTYTTPAKSYTEEQVFTLPTIASGEYIIALSILDPASIMPSARFAIKNYFNGGRHPIGKIGIGVTPKTFTVSDFDDIREDNTLYY